MPDTRVNVSELSNKSLPPAILPQNYRRNLVLASVGLLSLLGVYFGLLAALVVLACLGFAQVEPALQTGGWYGTLLGGPICVLSLLLVVLLVKPIVTLSARPVSHISLDSQDERVLFDFVRQLCDVVGAPMPRRIEVNCEVNASASFRLGVLSMLKPRADLTLTIGLPLAAGMDLKQFAALVTHELAHFTQNGGMRLGYFIRSIERWFARISHDRDSFDVALWECFYATGAHLITWPLAGLLLIGMGCVLVTRLLFHGFSWVACVLCGIATRQMEFAADERAAALVGSATFESLSEQIARLAAVEESYWSRVLSDLPPWTTVGELYDDLPGLLVTRVAAMPHDTRNAITRRISSQRTTLRSTHPSWPDRVDAVRRITGDLLLTDDGSAASLFADFPGLCRRATSLAYKSVCGTSDDLGNLLPTSRLAARVARELEAQAAARRFCRGIVAPCRPFFLGEIKPYSAGDSAQIAEDLRQFRDHLLQTLPSVAGIIPRLASADARLVRAVQACALVKAEVCIDPSAWGLPAPTQEAASEARRHATEELQCAIHDAAPIETILRDRFHASLSLACRLDEPGSSNAKPWTQTIDHLLEALGAMAGVLEQVISLRQELIAIDILSDKDQLNAAKGKLEDEIRRRIATIRDLVREIAGCLKAARYPFGVIGREYSISQYLVSWVPLAGDQAEERILEAAEQMLESYYALSWRIVGELAEIAERAEAQAGVRFDESPPV